MAEHWTVAPGVAGSSPVAHPKIQSPKMFPNALIISRLEMMPIGLFSLSMTMILLILFSIILLIAGPAQNAEARNLGASMEAFQKGRAERPL